MEGYLAREYPFDVLAAPESDYVIIFPDLPGCMTQVEDLAESAAREGLSLNSPSPASPGAARPRRAARATSRRQGRIEDHLLVIERPLADFHDSLRYRPSGVPQTTPQRAGKP